MWTAHLLVLVWLRYSVMPSAPTRPRLFFVFLCVLHGLESLHHLRRLPLAGPRLAPRRHRLFCLSFVPAKCSSFWTSLFNIDDKLQSSVTKMLDKLEWPSLEHRRKNQRLTTMFKISQGLVAVYHLHISHQRFPHRSKSYVQVQKHFSIFISLQEFILSSNNSTMEQSTVHKDIAEAPTLSCFQDRLQP